MAGPIVDLVLLRGPLGDTALRAGAVLAAKVLDREGTRGTLLIDGVRVQARLPPELAAGDALRVRVQEATAERVTLQVVPPQTPTDPSPQAVAVPLPGGARLRVEPETPGGGAPGAPGSRSLALRFDSPALGRLDILLGVDAQAASATVHVAPGAAQTARSAANDLRSALASATGRAASVAVHERPESVDVRG